MAIKKKGGDPKKPPKGTVPGKKPGKGGEKFDPKALSDGDVAKVLEDPRVFKTRRLAALLKDSKELKVLKVKQSKTEEKKLEKQGKFQTLLEKNKGELKTAQKAVKNLSLKLAVQAAAAAKGVTDFEAATKLVDTSKVTVDDEGNYSGVKKAVDALVKARPFLINNQQTVGSPTSPGQTTKKPGTFTISQIQDPEFYQKHRKKIIKAQREGRIIEDRQVVTAAPGTPASKPGEPAEGAQD